MIKPKMFVSCVFCGGCHRSGYLPPHSVSRVAHKHNQYCSCSLHYITNTQQTGRQCWLKALWVELTPCCFLYLGENVLANKPPPPFLEAQKLLINSPQTKARTSTSTWLCPNSLWGNIDQPSGTLSLRRLVEKYIFRGTFDWIVCGVVCGAGDGIVITGDPPKGAEGVLPPHLAFWNMQT